MMGRLDRGGYGRDEETLTRCPTPKRSLPMGHQRDDMCVGRDASIYAEICFVRNDAAGIGTSHLHGMKFKLTGRSEGNNGDVAMLGHGLSAGVAGEFGSRGATLQGPLRAPLVGSTLPRGIRRGPRRGPHTPPFRVIDLVGDPIKLGYLEWSG